MRDLIDDLLEYSRVGKKDEIANVSLNEIVNNVLSDLKPRIDASRASINIDSLPVMSVHPRSIALLFQNLLSNAIKFRRKEEPLQIRITAQRKNDHYQFAVSDNGIGIDPSQHNRIFGMFQRLHNYKEYEGTGIGLAHCQKIVQLHGGKIWVESEPGKGTTFYFTLPTSQNEE